MRGELLANANVRWHGGGQEGGVGLGFQFVGLQPLFNFFCQYSTIDIYNRKLVAKFSNFLLQLLSK